MRRLIFILCAMIGVSQAQTIQYIGAPTTTVISRGNFRTDSIFYLPKRTKAPTDTAAFRYQISDSSLYVWTGSQWIKAGGSGTLSGSGITGYLPQFSGTTTLDTSALYTLGSRLGIGTSTFAYNSTNTANIELNNTAGGILGFKRNDSARGYLWHTGDAMELANTSAGSISFNTNSATRGSISSAGVWRLHNLAGSGDRVVVASSNGTLSAASSATGLVDTLTISTRAWRQKGLDSLAALEVSGSGTTNYVPKFTAGSMIGNSQIFDNGTSVGIGTTSPDIYSGGSYKYLTVSNTTANGYTFLTLAGGAGGGGQIDFGSQNTRHAAIASFSNSGLGFYTNGTNSGTGVSERMRLTSSGELLINTTTDAGDYKLQISGNLYTSNGAYFGVIGDNVGVGTATPETKFHLKSSNALEWIETTTSNRSILGLQALDTDVRILSTYNTGGSNFVPITFWTSGAEKMRLSIDGEFLVNTTSDAGDYKLQISGNIYNTGSITTGAPSGGSIKPWKIGEAATVSPTSPNRTLRVEVDGVVYYIHAKTTND